MSLDMSRARCLVCPPSRPLRRGRRKSTDKTANLRERHLDRSIVRAAEVLK
ncbi:MAG: hypothetical protein LC808_27875 [Actinobacteria bacterium]|nr:hypothetical protein [Actinomycetota bacterium]